MKSSNKRLPKIQSKFNHQELYLCHLEDNQLPFTLAWYDDNDDTFTKQEDNKELIKEEIISVYKLPAV